MSTATESWEDEDHLSPQEKMISKLISLIIKSQEEMFHRLEKFQENMFCMLQNMLCDVLLQPPHKTLDIPSCSNSAGYDNDHVNTNPLFESEEKKSKDANGPSTNNDNDGEENTEAPEQDDQNIFESGLFKAAESGNWSKALEFFNNNPQVEMTNENCKIALRIAVLHNRLAFVEEFVKLLPPEALDHELKDNGFTALHTAAAYGYTEIAKVLVNKYPDLTQIRDKKGRVPLQLAIQAVTTGQKATVKYLYSVTKDEEQSSPFSGNDGAKLLCSAIDANFYDIALLIVKKIPELITKKQTITGNTGPSKLPVHNPCALATMIQRPLAFYSGAKLTWWQRKIYSLISVDMDSTCVNDAQADEQHDSKNQNLCSACLSKGYWNCTGLWYPLQLKTEAVNGTERDEENPQPSLEGNQLCKNNPLKSLACRMSGITQVLHIKQSIYKQKLMHKQALALIKEMFDQLHKTMTKPQVLEFFDKGSKMIKNAITNGTIEIGGETMIQMAVAVRNEKILDLICKYSGKEKMDLISRKDTTGNTLLHHVAKLAPPIQLNSVCGTALQLQREIQWFKGVESILPEADKVRRNKEGNTAHYIFTEEHKDLVVKGGEWMKNISEACMVVAALIATVAFAAVFTVPGGNISDTSSPKNGTPIFLGTKSFTAFAIADALALFSSISSVLMFLAIYTSRHAEQDFYRSLPQKLIIGLTTLFISMATIMVSFDLLGPPYPIAVLSCLPFILFASLQLPLFAEMVHSTYFHRLFRKHRYVRPCQQKNEKGE
ncbi:hypothetical protein MKW92_015517 [Papaver armeniacum]|nr:hypothetical protein MKW92_015517 [Papaver armeniacum]